MGFGVGQVPSAAEHVAGAVMDRRAGLGERRPGEAGPDEVAGVRVEIARILDHARQAIDEAATTICERARW